MTTGRGRETMRLALIIVCMSAPAYAKTSVPSDTLRRIYVALDQACDQIPASPRVDEACKLAKAVKAIMEHPEEDAPPAPAPIGKPVENRSVASPPTIADDETYQQEMQRREMQRREQREMRQREAQRQWQVQQAPPPPMLDEIFCQFFACY
jgi:hypothetical protein